MNGARVKVQASRFRAKHRFKSLKLEVEIEVESIFLYLRWHLWQRSSHFGPTWELAGEYGPRMLAIRVR